jgi:site-specific recombinase XerD
MGTMEKYIKIFLEYQVGCGYSEGTIKRSRYYLNRFRKWFSDDEIREIGKEKIFEYLEYLRELKNNRGKALSEKSVGVELSNLRSFFSYLYKSEYLVINPVEDVELMKKGDDKGRKVFSEEEISRVLDSIEIKTAIGMRDRSFFELLYSSGLRFFELRELKLEEMNLEDRLCLVKGKGKKERYVPFSETACKFLLKYIVEGRKKLLRRSRNTEVKQYLFLSKKGKVSWKVMRNRMRKYLENAGLEVEEYGLHSIRHTTATHLLSNGASIRYVQELLGHESLKTTQLYTRPMEESIKRKYRSFHPRENEYYKEIEAEYLEEIEKLKDRLIWQKKETRKQKERLRRGKKGELSL